MVVADFFTVEVWTRERYSGSWSCSLMTCRSVRSSLATSRTQRMVEQHERHSLFVQSKNKSRDFLLPRNIEPHFTDRFQNRTLDHLKSALCCRFVPERCRCSESAECRNPSSDRSVERISSRRELSRIYRRPILPPIHPHQR